MIRLTKSQERAVLSQAQLTLGAQAAPTLSPSKETLCFDIPLRGMGAVRQTKKDSFNPTDAVILYRKWRDQLREACGVEYIRQGRLRVDTRFQDADEAHIVAYFKTNAEALWGKLHKQVPDSDNIYKAVTDALFVKDDGIAVCHCEKYWAQHDGLVIVLKEVVR